MVAIDATAPASGRRSRQLLRHFVISAISFLTLIDLFATQAILPSLARVYGVAPATMGSAVNLSTLGMAIAGFAVALFSRRINRRAGVSISLALLAIPTSLLAFMPDLAIFAGLRLVQGLFMSAAFTLTITYLAETAGPDETAAALAAYVTGNVASNLFGRLMAAAIVDHLGLSANFWIFAALNLAGAALAFFALRRCQPMESGTRAGPRPTWSSAFTQIHLIASFAIGFVILFVFIGAFTYVNFVLSAPPIGLSPMQLGVVYFVFVPSIILTPLAGSAAHRFGAQKVVISALGLAALALLPLLAGTLVAVLLGLVIFAAGTFFAQAAATGYVSRTSGTARSAAGGLYLASYYAGGLAGSVILGQIFDRFGWSATVAALGLALLCGCLFAKFLTEPCAP